MTLTRISKNELFGIHYVKHPDGLKWDGYYKTIDVLRNLFADPEFTAIVKGFYLNICGDLDSVRISYFVHHTNKHKTAPKFQQFIQENGLIEVQQHEPPKGIMLAAKYGGKRFEEQFRNFLVLETQVGLDLIRKDLLNARILFATYRWRVRKASLPIREHFEPTFKRNSAVYNSLSDREKTQLFEDLEEWPNPHEVDWAHMMVNFVLGCDWTSVFGDPSYLSRGNPYPILAINRIIEDTGLGFQIPLDWKP